MAKDHKEINKKIIDLINTYNPNGDFRGKTPKELEESRKAIQDDLLSKGLSQEEIKHRLKKKTIEYGILGKEHPFYKAGKKAVKEIAGIEMQDKKHLFKVRLIAEGIGDELRAGASKLKNTISNKLTKKTHSKEGHGL